MFRSVPPPVLCLFLLFGAGSAFAQCAPGTIGVYFDQEGLDQVAYVTKDEILSLYIIVYAENPIQGAAWKLEVSSPQLPGAMVGPFGPNCQPPGCYPQDPPFWYVGTEYEGSVSLGDPFTGGVLQALDSCHSGFFGNPVLLATVNLWPWADVLGAIEVIITVTAPDGDQLSYTDCVGGICTDVVGLTSYIATEVIDAGSNSWGDLKHSYR